MELKKLFNLLWRRKLVLIVTAAMTVVVAVIGTRYMRPVYTASTTLRVAVSASGTLNYQDYMYADRLMNTYVEIAKSEPIAQQLSEQLLLVHRPTIDAKIVPNTELIEITVQETNPVRAATEANALAQILTTEESQLYAGGGTKVTDVLQQQVGTAQADMDRARQQYEKLLVQTPSAPDRIQAQGQLLSLSQANYESLLSQYQQAQFREQIQASMITVWQKALVPQRPSSPVPLLNYALGLFVGLVGGMGLALVLENLDTTLYTTAEIEATTKRTALALIPAGSKQQVRHFQRDFSPVAEAFRNLATLLQQRNSRNKGNVVLIMSAQPSQGKSTVAFQLAASLAEMGKSILVIDCDTRVPRLHALFHIPNDRGLRDVLEDKMAPEEAIQKTSIERVSVLTNTALPAHPTQLVSSAQMVQLIAELKQRFDYVLLDSPALLAVADTAALYPCADLAILVARRGYTTREALRSAENFFEESTSKPVYLVVNYAESNHSYGYYHYRTKSDRWTAQLEEILIRKQEHDKETSAD